MLINEYAAFKEWAGVTIDRIPSDEIVLEIFKKIMQDYKNAESSRITHLKTNEGAM